MDFKLSYAKMDNMLANSSVIIHESAIRWLFQNGLLLKFWDTLKERAKSVKLVGDSFKNISPTLESVLRGNLDDFIYYWQQFLLKIKDSRDILHSISENHNEFIEKCDENNIKDEHVKELVTLLSELAPTVEHAILVTDIFQPINREFIIATTISGLVEIPVKMISIFDFFQFFYIRCCLTLSEFLNFANCYVSELLRANSLDSKIRDSYILTHLKNSISAAVLKESIGVINKIEKCNYKGDVNQLIAYFNKISHDHALQLFETAFSHHGISYDTRHISGGTGEEWGCDFILESRIGFQIKVEGEIDRKELGKLSDQYLKAQNRIRNLSAYVIAFCANINDTADQPKTTISKGVWRQDQISRIITKFAGYEYPPVIIIRPTTIAKFLGSDLS